MATTIPMSCIHHEQEVQNVDRCGDTDEMHTIPVARYQNMIDNGRAMIYRMRLVKFNSKAKLPRKPHANDIAFRMTSL